MALEKINNIINNLEHKYENENDYIEFENVLSLELMNKKYIITTLISDIFGLRKQYNQINFLHKNFGILTNETDLIDFTRIYFTKKLNLTYQNFNFSEIIKNNLIFFVNNLKNNPILRLNLSRMGNEIIPLINALKDKESLKCLNLAHNNFCGNNKIICVSEILKTLRLNSLDLSYNYLEKHIYHFNDILKSIPYLNLSRNNLGTNISFSKLLKEDSKIISLNLADNRIGLSKDDMEIKMLYKSLKNNNTLKYLNLSFNYFNKPKYYKYFAKILKINYTLRYLNLSHCQLKGFECIKIFRSLKYNGLITLDLSFNHLKSNEINYLAKSLKINTSLRYLYLSNNYLKDINQLVDALKNSKLKSLDLSSGKIDENGFILLADLLKTNTNLQHLNLAFNNVKKNKNGHIQLFNSLKVNRTLKTLILYQNNINGNDCLELAEALCNNTLEHLNLAFNNLYSSKYFNYNGIFQICNALKLNTSLEYLDLSGNKLKNNEIVYIISALKVNKTLKHLSLINSLVKSSKFPDMGLLELVKSLNVNNSLQCLNLSYNYIETDIVIKIFEILKNNTGLQYINLSDNNIDNNIINYLIEKSKPNKTLRYIKITNTYDIHE